MLWMAGEEEERANEDAFGGMKMAGEAEVSGKALDLFASVLESGG